MKMGVLLGGLSAFWAPVVTGANLATSELKLSGSVAGPANPNGDHDATVALQRAYLQQAVAENYDGLGIARISTDENPDIDAATAKNIPVVTLDSDAPDTMRGVFVGTISTDAGVKGAQTILGMLPAAPGTVVLFGNTDVQWTDGIARTTAAQGALVAAGLYGHGGQLDMDSDRPDVDVAALKDAITTANPPAVGMLGVFSTSFRCAMAAEALGKTSADLTIVTFDFDPITVQYMRSGLVKATHVQREYYEGYLVPYILYGIKSLGLDKTKQILHDGMVDDGRFSTGIDIVTADKIDTFNAFLDSIGANNH